MTPAEEREQLLSRLRTAHRIAGIGSWEGVFHDGRQALDWSPEVHEIAGWPADRSPTFADFVSLIHPDDRPAFFEVRDAALAGHRPYEMDLRLVRPDGDVRHVHIAAHVERGPDGRPTRLIGVTQDRTEEIESLRRLRVTEASRRQLLERLLDAADHERERIGRHLAVGAVEQLRSVEASMAPFVDDEAPASWHDALDSVRRSIASLTATLSTITDAAPGRDLASVVADLAADARRTMQVTCEVDVDPVPRPGVRAVIVRLVQEGLQNVRKHADAGRATVEVRSQGDEVVVRVGDDGRGFDPDQVRHRRGHFGLASLRDDLDAVGGRLEVRSGPQGTVLEARLPAS